MIASRTGRAEVLLVRAATAAVFVYVLSRTWADPDLWGHVRFGGDIARAGTVHPSDGYTFTGLGDWVNPSWLADLLMYGTWVWGGAAGLIAAKLVVAAAIVLVTASTLRRGGVRGARLELWLLLCVAAIYSATQTVRPQLLALLLFATLVHVQAGGSSRWPRQVVAIPLAIALWVNLHGSWVLGLAEVGIWSGVEMVAPKTPRRERLQIGATVALTLAATCITPYGLALWEQLWNALGSSLRDVSEWRSLLETRSPALVVWLVLVGLGVAVLVQGRGRPSEMLVLAWLAWQSWQAIRLLPFFGIAAVGFLAPRFPARVAPSPGDGRPPRPDPPRLTRVVLASVSILLLVTCALGTGRSLGCLRIDHTREADMQAAAFIARNRLQGRLLSYSDWGLYALWHFAPALQVSLDGRREFAYPRAELERHAAIYWNAPTAVADVDALAPDYVWLPRSLPVVPVLTASGRWGTVFETDRSVVLARPEHAASGSWVRTSSAALPRCFPGDPLP